MTGWLVSWVAFGVAGLAALQTHPRQRRLPASRFRATDYDARVPGPVLRMLSQMALPVSPAVAVSGWCSGVVVVAVIAAVRGLSGAVVLLAVVLLAAPVTLVLKWRGRRDRLIHAALPSALEGIGRAVRSGATFGQAVGETAGAIPGPLGEDLRELHRHVGLGVGFTRAVVHWSDRRPAAAVQLAAAALIFSHEAGGARSRALDGLADSLRDQLAVEAEIVALAAQARLSALVVAVMPVGFVLLSTSVDDTIADFLFRQSTGIACLVAGVGLDVVGFLWMRRMTAVIK